MAGGTTSFNIEKAQAALSNLQSEAPQENEMNNIFTQAANELKPLSSQHDGFLDGYIGQLEPGGELYSGFETVNNEYTDYMEKLSSAIEKMQAERNGRVDRETGGTTSTGGNPSPSSDIKPSETPPGDTPTTPIVPGVPTSNVPGNETPEGTTPPGTTPGATTGKPVGDTPTGPGETPAAAAAGIAAATAIASDEIGGLGSPDGIEDPVHSNNPFGDHSIPESTFTNMTSEEQAVVRNKLKELGFSDNEIDEILRGVGTVPSVEIDPVASALEKALAKDPSLRQQLIAKYGFDIFNADGTVDKDRLALALMMDNKNGTDDFSLLDLLRTKYGISVVNPTDFTNLSSRLESLLKKYPDLRDKLIAKYGFDIFNPDGTINRDKLVIAMLMDQQNGSDSYDLIKLLNELYGEEGLATLLGSVAKPVKAAEVKNSGVGVVPIAAGIGAIGALAGGTALLIKKKKDEEEEEEQNEDDALLNDDPTAVVEKSVKGETPPPSPTKEGEKEWLHGLGLGLAATPSNGIDEANKKQEVEEKIEKESEYIRLDKVKPGRAEGESKFNFAPLIAAGAAAGVTAKVIKDKKDEEEKTSEKEKEGFEW